MGKLPPEWIVAHTIAGSAFVAHLDRNLRPVKASCLDLKALGHTRDRVLALDRSNPRLRLWSKIPICMKSKDEGLMALSGA
jgi:hypothetical protein